MNKPVKKLLIPLLILGAAAAVAVLLVKTRPESKPVVTKEKAWPVAAREVTPQRLSPELTLYGRIEAQWDSRLTAAVAAEVAEVAIREGDEVAAGDLLVRLDDADTRLRLAQAEADLAQAQARIDSALARNQANLEALPREENLLALARKELQRLTDLHAKKLASQSALDSARQTVDRQAITLSNRQQSIREHEANMAELRAAKLRAEAQRDQAALDLGRTGIRAPFAGRIAQLLVSPGQRVKVGDGLVSLYDTGSLLVRAQIPDSQLAQVRDAMAAGSPLEVSGELDGRPLSARLQNLAGEVGQGGGVAGLFALQNPDAGVRPGRFVQLTLKLPARDGLVAVPAQALYGLDRIYIVDPEQRLQARQVTRIGEMRLPDGSSRVLIEIDGIRTGDRVVTTQLPNAVEGLKVSVVPGNG